ncbi:MAG: hypothetical protein ACREJ3_18250 [Polyangiaceae bacterium]
MRRGARGRERRLLEMAPERASARLRDKIAPHIEGPGGIAANVARLIGVFAQEHPDRADRSPPHRLVSACVP